MERRKRKFKENSVLRLLDCNWDELYAKCNMWNVAWHQFHHPESHMWPDGYKLHGNLRTGYKLYFEEKLCVPTGLGYKIVAAQHIISGHIGANKLVMDLKILYNFGYEPPIREMATKIKAMCVTFQACEPPNWTMKGPLHMTPVLP